MVAVGLYAASLDGRAMYLVPAAFVAMMAVGGAIGISGVALPFVELGIALSVLVLGAAVALRIPLSTMAAVALVGSFAIFHGHAHGAELPLGTSGLSYAVGFVVATALLHAVGIGSRALDATRHRANRTHCRASGWRSDRAGRRRPAFQPGLSDRTTSATPCRHDRCAGRQPSSCLALVFEPDRTCVIMIARCSPATRRVSQPARAAAASRRP